MVKYTTLLFGDVAVKQKNSEENALQFSGSGIFSLTWCKQQYSEQFLDGIKAKPMEVPVMKGVISGLQL